MTKTIKTEDLALDNHNYLLSVNDIEKENRRKKRSRKYNKH